MRVSDKLDYEVSFWFKNVGTIQPCFELSYNGFDCFDNILTSHESNGGTADNRWIKSTDQTVSKSDQWYFARFCLFNYQHPVEPNVQPSTSLSVGNNLIMAQNTTNVIVNLLCTNAEIRLYNFKFKPLYTKFSTGFVQGSNMLQVWRKNNNKTLSEKQVDSIAQKLLFPYNTSNVNIQI
jgi:hypothetical protein